MMAPFLLLSPLPLLVVVLLVVHVEAADYRLQTTSYAVTLETSLDSKTKNCQNSFGNDAFVMDFENAKTDFTPEEFKEALTGVFFKAPNAVFYVTYQGKDIANDQGHHFALKMSPTSKNNKPSGIDQFANAILQPYARQAQILCAVPIKEYQPNKAYTSPEDQATSTRSSNVILGWGKFIILVVVVGGALVVRKQFIDNGMGPSLPRNRHSQSSPGNRATSLLSDAYYSVLDQKAGGNNPFDDDGHSSNNLAESLTQQGCELSYNPAQQGMV